MALTVRFFFRVELVCVALIVLRGNPMSRVLLRGATPCHVRVPFSLIRFDPLVPWFTVYVNTGLAWIFGVYPVLTSTYIS